MTKNLNKRNLFIIGAALFGICILGMTGPAQADVDYEVGSMTVVSSIGDENDVYYPVVSDDIRTDLADTFPMIVLFQGGKSDKGLYSGYASELAKRGYVIAIANHFRPLGPPGTPPDKFSSVNGMVSSMELLQSLDADASSPLYLIVDQDTLGIQGHSFGGGVAMWAVEGTCGYYNVFCDSMGPAGPVPYFKPVELKAAVLWATSSYANNMGPYPVLLDPDTSENPVVIFSGGNDHTSPVEEALDTYPLLDSSKAILEFDGMTHYGICDVEDPEGNTPDEGEPDISQEEGHRRIAKWADRFFKIHLYGHTGMQKRIYEKKRGENGVTIVEADF